MISSQVTRSQEKAKRLRLSEGNQSQPKESKSDKPAMVFNQNPFKNALDTYHRIYQKVVGKNSEAIWLEICKDYASDHDGTEISLTEDPFLAIARHYANQNLHDQFAYFNHEIIKSGQSFSGTYFTYLIQCFFSHHLDAYLFLSDGVRLTYRLNPFSYFTDEKETSISKTVLYFSGTHQEFRMLLDTLNQETLIDLLDQWIAIEIFKTTKKTAAYPETMALSSRKLPQRMQDIIAKMDRDSLMKVFQMQILRSNNILLLKNHLRNLREFILFMHHLGLEYLALEKCIEAHANKETESTVLDIIKDVTNKAETFMAETHPAPEAAEIRALKSFIQARTLPLAPADMSEFLKKYHGKRYIESENEEATKRIFIKAFFGKMEGFPNFSEVEIKSEQDDLSESIHPYSEFLYTFVSLDWDSAFEACFLLWLQKIDPSILRIYVSAILAKIHQSMDPEIIGSYLSIFKCIQDSITSLDEKQLFQEMVFELRTEISGFMVAKLYPDFAFAIKNLSMTDILDFQHLNPSFSLDDYYRNLLTQDDPVILQKAFSAFIDYAKLSPQSQKTMPFLKIMEDLDLFHPMILGTLKSYMLTHPNQRFSHFYGNNVILHIPVSVLRKMEWSAAELQQIIDRLKAICLRHEPSDWKVNLKILSGIFHKISADDQKCFYLYFLICMKNHVTKVFSYLELLLSVELPMNHDFLNGLLPIIQERLSNAHQVTSPNLRKLVEFSQSLISHPENQKHELSRCIVEFLIDHSHASILLGESCYPTLIQGYILYAESLALRTQGSTFSISHYQSPHLESLKQFLTNPDYAETYLSKIFIKKMDAYLNANTFHPCLFEALQEQVHLLNRNPRSLERLHHQFSSLYLNSMKWANPSSCEYYSTLFKLVSSEIRGFVSKLSSHRFEASPNVRLLPSLNQ